MAKVFIDDSILEGWANAIREKLRITYKMKPSALLEKTVNELDDKDILDDFLEIGVIGDYHNDKLTRLRGFAFAGNSNMTSASFPNVAVIDYFAFQMCTNLKSVSLPNAASASNTVFSNCTTLVEVNLPVLKTASNQFFQFCKSLKTLELPSLEKCNQSLVNGCSALEEIDLPKLQEAQCQNMFSNCEALKTINMPMLTTLGEGGGTTMFSNCTALENITLGSGCFIDNVSFAQSPLLTDESVQNIINALATVETTKTLTLHADVKAKLTEEQLATIASKNWTVK